jgi:hypothetical protein
MMFALHMNPKSLRWAGPHVLECLHLVTYAVCKDSLSLAYAPLHLKKNKEFVKLACSVNPTAIKFADETVRGDRRFVKPILYEDGGLLEYMSNEIKNDERMVSLAMRKCGAYPMRYASERLLDNKSFVYDAVFKNWECLEFASRRLQNSKRIARLAIERSPDAIDYMGTWVLKNCPDILDVAITATGGKIAFNMCYFKLLSKKQLIAALTLKPSSYGFLPDHLKRNGDIVTAVLTKDWTVVRMISNVTLQVGFGRNMYTIIQHDDWYYVPDTPVELKLPWGKYRNNLMILIEGIKKDRRIIRHASSFHKGHPRLVMEAIKCYEDVGKGMIDPLKTAPYKWCNMVVLAECISMLGDDKSEENFRKRNKLLSHFLYRFSNDYLTEAIGVSRVMEILKKNVDLFHPVE